MLLLYECSCLAWVSVWTWQLVLKSGDCSGLSNVLALCPPEPQTGLKQETLEEIREEGGLRGDGGVDVGSPD